MEDMPPPPQPSSVIQEPTSSTQPGSEREDPGTERTQTSQDEVEKAGEKSVAKVTPEQTIVCEENPVIIEMEEGKVNVRANVDESGSPKEAGKEKEEEEDVEKSQSQKPKSLKIDSENVAVKPVLTEGTAALAVAVVGRDEKEQEKEEREEKEVLGEKEEGMEVEPSTSVSEREGGKCQTSESMETGDVEKIEAKEDVEGNSEGEVL